MTVIDIQPPKPPVGLNGRAGSLLPWRFKHPIAVLFFALVAIVVIAPIISLVHIALGGDVEIWKHLAAYVIPAALVDTLLLLIGVAIVTTIAGVGAAWIVTTFSFPGRGLLLWFLPLPLAIPTYIIAYIYVDVFDTLGTVPRLLHTLVGGEGAPWFINVRSLPGAIFVMGFVLYPYVYLAARAMFQTQSASLLEMARTLGASPWRLARDVSLPLARPAIMAGVALVLLETLNDIGASEYLGVRTLTLAVFTTWLNRGSLAGAAQIASVMLLVVFLLIVIEQYGRGRRRYVGTERPAHAARRIALDGWRAGLAATACAVPVAFGFVIPVIYLAHEVLVRSLLVGFDSSLVGHAAFSVGLAGAATLITLLLGFGAVLAWRLVRGSFAASCISIAALGYGLPGTVLALGLLSPVIAIDDTINWVTRTATGMDVGLVMIGSGAALIIAYVVRFLAIAIGFGHAGLARIPTDLDDAARAVGARPRSIMWSIQVPLARPALWGAALLIFVDCLKELPATLLLRPLNVETLPTYIYQFATRGNFEEGALAALLIVAVGVLPIIRMVRHADEATNVGIPFSAAPPLGAGETSPPSGSPIR